MAEHFTVSTFSSSGTPPVSPRKSSGKSNSTDDFEPLAQLMAVPSSPTDEIMSPCSSRLWNPQRKHSSTKRFYNIHSELTPRPNPAGNLRLILGSSSGNRKMVIEILHWKFLQVFPGIDEKAVRSEDPMELPLLVAKAKATAVIEKLKQIDTSIVPSIVITMDQVVLFKDTIREKPESETEAVQFLSSYSDQMVSTISGVVVTHFPSMVQRSGVDVAKVYWKTISPQIVRKVVNKNEIYKSAGGFKIEDDDLNPLIRRIEGSMASVMGFPIELVENLVKEVIDASTLEHIDPQESSTNIE